jgi:hypothetical protein
MKKKQEGKWLQFLKSKEVRAGLGVASLCLQLFLQFNGERTNASRCQITVQSYEAHSSTPT